MELSEKKQEITETLHIPALRRKWQILVLQTVSTVSLLLLLKRMSDVYGPCSDDFILNKAKSMTTERFEFADSEKVERFRIF